MNLKIGRLAALTHTNAPTIRYYEAIGLLPRPRRERGGQRTYDDGDVSRLLFIRQCREFGFAIEQSRDLLSLMHDRSRSCMDAGKIVQDHLVVVRRKLKALKALERRLTDLVTEGSVTCRGGAGPDCTLLRDMAVSRVTRGKSRHARGARGSRS